MNVQYAAEREAGHARGPVGLDVLGIRNINNVYWNLTTPALLDGKLERVAYKTDSFFGLQVPESCEGVPSEVLTPSNTWNDKAAYNKKATELAKRFADNFKEYKDHVNEEVIKAGPQI